jgi:hypothetical protein
MVDLAPADVARRQREVAAEEEWNRKVPAAYQHDCDRLTPMHECGSDVNLYVSRVEPGCTKLGVDPLPNNGVVLATFARNACPDCRSRLLRDPHLSQPAELDDSEENRQEHEGNSQHCLQGLLSALFSETGHDVCARRCTI